MTADPLALLDELDEARAKATPGTWHVAPSGGIDAGDYDTVIGRGDVDCMAHCYGGTSTIEGDNLAVDAALIVAAVNAQPKLTAALRAVAELADKLEGYTRRRGRPAEGSYDYGVNLAQADAADAIRAAVTAALTAEPAR